MPIKSNFSSNAKARVLHENAERAREQDDHFGALKLLDEAIFKYKEEGDYAGLVLALQSRFLTYKHLFFLTKDKAFAVEGKKNAEVGLEIALRQKLSNVMGSCYFRLGEAAMLFKDYLVAIVNYQKALVNFSGAASEKGDYRYHLGEALYRSGKKEEGERMMLLGLEEIKSGAGETDSFLIHVWESGCYMKLAELLREDKPGEAKRYLTMAKNIIGADSRLLIRKRQLKELLNSGDFF